MIEIIINKDHPKSLEEFKKIVKDTTRDDLIQALYGVSKQALEFQTELQDANDSIIWWRNRYEAQCKINDRKTKEIEILQNDLDRVNSNLKEQTERNLRAIEYININSKLIHKKDIGHICIMYREMEDVTDLIEILEGVAK